MSFKKHFLRILMSMQAIKKRKLGELSFTEAWEIKQKNGYVTIMRHPCCMLTGRQSEGAAK